MLIIMESVCMLLSEVIIDASYGQVHLRQFPCREIVFLSINGNITYASLVFFHKPFTLYEHTARATTRVIDSPFIRLNHLNKQFNDGRWCIELTGILTFG